MGFHKVHLQTDPESHSSSFPPGQADRRCKDTKPVVRSLQVTEGNQQISVTWDMTGCFCTEKQGLFVPGSGFGITLVHNANISPQMKHIFPMLSCPVLYVYLRTDCGLTWTFYQCEYVRCKTMHSKDVLLRFQWDRYGLCFCSLSWKRKVRSTYKSLSGRNFKTTLVFVFSLLKYWLLGKHDCNS